jgi:hypothetical protein
MPEEPNIASGGAVRGTTTPLVHKSPPEIVEMNKFEFILALSEVQQRPKGPTVYEVVVPLFFAIGLLLTLLPTDFKEFGGVPASTWQAVVITLVIVAGIWFVALLLRFAYCAYKYPARSPRQFYQDLVEEMARQRAEIEKIEKGAEDKADREG